MNSREYYFKMKLESYRNCIMRARKYRLAGDHRATHYQLTYCGLIRSVIMGNFK